MATRTQLRMRVERTLGERPNQLDKAIRQMNEESKRLFKDTFDAVNARIKQVFPRLFQLRPTSLRRPVESCATHRHTQGMSDASPQKDVSTDLRERLEHAYDEDGVDSIADP